MQKELLNQRDNSFRRTVRILLEGLRKVDTVTLTDGWLAQVALYEGFFGPNLFGIDKDGKSMWTYRVERASALAADVRKDAHGPSIVAMQWDLLAGFWLLMTDQFGDARARLGATLAEARQCLAPADGFLDTIEKLHAAAVVLLAADPALGSSVSPEDRSAAIAVLTRPDSAETTKGSDGVRKVLARARETAQGK